MFHNKVNFAFKLGSLTAALFSLLIIVLYVSYQWSFDTFHNDHENIYRVNSNRDEDGKLVGYSMLPPAIGPALKQERPEVLAYARLSVANKILVQYQDKLFRFPGFVEADSSIFDVLTFTFIKGDKSALRQHGSVVLTETLARQIFGNEDPINKVITSPDHSNRLLNVTAVIKDLPVNSHLLINAIHDFGSLQRSDLGSWQITWDGSVNLYVRLSPGTDPKELANRAEPVLRKNLAKSEDGSEKRFGIYLQSIAGIYLDPPLKMEFGRKGNPIYVYIFSMLGIFLLAIASTNYVNLSIADFETRTREIGVRKILGARKSHIAFHVFLEAFTISLLALMLSVLILYVVFPFVSSMLDNNLRFAMLATPGVITLMVCVVTILVIGSIAYPAYKLMFQNPIKELKSSIGYGSMSVGRILLLAQYAISIICICTTLIVGKQLSYLKETDLGYERSHVVSLVMPDEYPSDRINVLRNEMNRLAGVESVSYSYYLMPVSTYFKGWYQVEKDGKMEKILLNEMFVDHDYFETMGIKVIAGRGFDVKYASDSRNGFIINETAAKELGWENPLGKRIRFGYTEETDRQGDGTVIGVVKDFHTLSLHKKIEPVVLRLQYDSWPGNALNVKVRGSLAEMLPVITSTYERIMPGFLADARVVEDLYNRQYQDENKAFAFLQIGTIIIIAISLLGVFSLSLYLSVRRMKEFGIRKVLGATVPQIAALHVSYFLKIVLMANLVALPLAYWFMNQWLDDFAYRTEPGNFIFPLVMLASFFLVVVSGGYSAWKAGQMNPIDVIKME